MGDDEHIVASVLAKLGDDNGAPTAAKPAAPRSLALGQKKAARPSRGKKNKRTLKPPKVVYPVEPTIVRVIKMPKTYQNHSYRDFSVVPPSSDYNAPTKIEDMSFSEKIHAILSSGENTATIDWLPHGRAFHVLVPKDMEANKILKTYFGHNRFSSFLRQLNDHGFKHISQGVDRNSYYHECFLQGLPHLCQYMPPEKDARRLIPDPPNEPNFYDINKHFPLSKDAATSKQPAPSAAPPPQTSTAPAPLLQIPSNLNPAALQQLGLAISRTTTPNVGFAGSRQSVAAPASAGFSLPRPVSASTSQDSVTSNGFPSIAAGSQPVFVGAEQLFAAARAVPQMAALQNGSTPQQLALQFAAAAATAVAGNPTAEQQLAALPFMLVQLPPAKIPRIPMGAFGLTGVNMGQGAPHLQINNNSQVDVAQVRAAMMMQETMSQLATLQNMERKVQTDLRLLVAARERTERLQQLAVASSQSSQNAAGTVSIGDSTVDSSGNSSTKRKR